MGHHVNSEFTEVSKSIHEVIVKQAWGIIMSSEFTEVPKSIHEVRVKQGVGHCCEKCGSTRSGLPLTCCNYITATKYSEHIINYITAPKYRLYLWSQSEIP